MPVYWVSSYYVKPEKAADYQKWLNSQQARQLFKRFERETGFKYLNTYVPILGFGDYDAEDWYVAPDWTAFDKLRASKAGEEWVAKTWDLLDQTRAAKSRAMRTAQEVKVFGPPKKK